jgi:sugar lactone lactonase YvrE
MKKFIRIIILTVLFALANTRVSADTPYTTWAWGPGGWLVRTQDAYTPVAEVDLPISSAEDMFMTPDGVMYIADTGDGQILKMKDFQVIGTYGKGILQGPTGIYVDDQGTMYVADASANSIFLLDQNGNLLKQFGRPVEPLFGKDKEFLPRKIEVDARQNLYIIS